MHHKALRKAQARAKPRKAWAIVSDDGIVEYDNTAAPVRPLLIFSRKYQALGAVWRPSERVVSIWLTPAT